MKKTIVMFGEALFRLSAERGERLHNTSRLDFYLGGTELNIAANLSSLGFQTSFVTTLPQGAMGDLVETRIRAMGVETTFIDRQPGRMGFYLLEPGPAPRGDVVVTRQAGLLSDLKALEIPWDKALVNARVFHTSGITAGLSEITTQAVIQSLQKARAQGCLTSYDFNFRATLWPIETAVQRQKPVLGHIDVLFASRRDLELFFDWKENDTGFKSVFDKGVKTIVLSERNPEETQYRVTCATAKEIVHSRWYAFQTLDRIGVGDSMAAGFWSANLQGQSLKECAETAAAAGALKYTIKGDQAVLRKSELENLIERGYKAIER